MNDAEDATGRRAEILSTIAALTRELETIPEDPIERRIREMAERGKARPNPLLPHREPT